ncbi:MAG: 30S ribosomal protein S6, partial [Clostridia bacterium]|nr:30S ribosomal protein S6 [Clostridia bacterium]
MHSYESMFIVRLANGEEAAKATVNKFTDLIKANAENVQIDEWGKRRLAYPIEDMNEGYYTVTTFKSESDFPAELQRLMNIDE